MDKIQNRLETLIGKKAAAAAMLTKPAALKSQAEGWF